MGPKLRTSSESIAKLTMTAECLVWCAISELDVVLRVDISGREHVYDLGKAIADASNKKIPLLRAEIWRVMCLDSSRRKTLTSCNRLKTRMTGLQKNRTNLGYFRRTMKTYKRLRIYYFLTNYLLRYSKGQPPNTALNLYFGLET